MVSKMYNKVCKDCGAEFTGARNAKYCPECKVSRRKETQRRYEASEKRKEANRRYKANRLAKLYYEYGSYDALPEKDKKFIRSIRDCRRLIETNLKYGLMKPNKAGYERHHIIPYLTCIHYWELTGDDYYLDLTWKEENLVDLIPEDHNTLHSKLSKFGYSKRTIISEDDWEEYRELVFDLINDKGQSTLLDYY